MNWEKIFGIAAQITSPVAAAVFCACLLAAVIIFAKLKDKIVYRILASGILLLGSLPIAARLVLASRGIYHVQIQVLGLDGQPVAEAKVTASAMGVFKRSGNNFEFDLAPQSKPSSGEVTFFATVPDSYLAGQSVLTLKDSYYPTISIKLATLPSVAIRGTVVDQHDIAMPGTTISVVGYEDSTITDANGNFVLPSHHASGQSFSLRAVNGKSVSETLQIAGAGEIQIVLARKRS